MSSWRNLLVGFAISALVGAAMANAAATRAGDQSGGSSPPAGEQCAVRIDRVAADGAFSVARLVRENGQCVCIASTGKSSQGGSAESAVGALLRSRSCADAPPAVAEAASSGGMSGAVLGVVGAGALVGAGVGVAGGSDSPGS